MKYQIMISIMMLLLQKRRLTARQIAEKYDISTRSVYRYIEELDVSGVPACPRAFSRARSTPRR